MKENIENIGLYNDRMKKSLKDKLFFLKKIKKSDADTIVDFGCADGELLKNVNNNWKKIGIDCSPKMCKLAKENVKDGEFFKDFKNLDISLDNSILNLSSVIHEVYSYLSPKEVKRFWDNVFHKGFKYIVIRDMSVSKDLDRPADKELISKILDATKDLKHLKMLNEHIYVTSSFKENNSDPDKLSQKDLVHYLLKYRYENNWERECCENYLPLWTEDLISLIPENYKIIYKKHFILPFIKKDIKKNFKYNLKDPTHIKLILKKVK